MERILLANLWMSLLLLGISFDLGGNVLLLPPLPPVDYLACVTHHLRRLPIALAAALDEALVLVPPAWMSTGVVVLLTDRNSPFGPRFTVSLALTQAQGSSKTPDCCHKPANSCGHWVQWEQGSYFKIEPARPNHIGYCVSDESEKSSRDKLISCK